MNPLNLSQELKRFKHSKRFKAQFADIDSFFVVHNIKYLYWVESAREDYLTDILNDCGIESDIYNYPLVVVHTEIDYFKPARYFDLIDVYTRVKSVKESSLVIENYIVNGDSVLAVSSAVLVKINTQDGNPERISDEVRKAIVNYEENEVTGWKINNEYK